MNSRREFLLGAAAVAMTTQISTAKKPMKQRILFGTNAGGTSQGIYIADWTSSTGEVGELTLAASIVSPTWLAKHAGPHGQFVFAVSEETDKSGSVASFLLEDGARTLKRLSMQTADGAATTHLSVHPDGRSLYAANYSGGSVSSFHVRPDGSISPIVSHMQYHGSGPNKDRQEAPHAHSAQVSPDGRYLLVNDLGLDRINVYRINAATAELMENDPPFWQAQPGSGPRHIAFHPSHKFVFNVDELSSSVDVLAWDANEGSLKTLSSVGLLPAGVPQSKAHAAEIAVTRDGRFVYANNRGENSIACMTFDIKTAKLEVFQHAGNGGENTRFITLSPDERFIIVNNQDSGTIVILERDHRTGRLSAPVHTYKLDRVMCTLFV